MRQLLRRGTGHGSTIWPVLLLLLIVLVPSAGVVWMMRAAMQNERLAVRQRLADAYHAQLDFAKRRIDSQWQTLLARLEAIATEHPPARAFSECVLRGAADGVVILDGNGRVLYPAATTAATATANTAPVEQSDPAWNRAERLEFAENKPSEAAKAYRAIALEGTDTAAGDRARQAEARCLLRAGDREGAIAALQVLRNRDVATDSSGRSLAADAELRLLELQDAGTTEWPEIAASLANRLNNYDGPLPPSEQRRFLMHALQPLKTDVSFRTLEAEDLAAAFISNSTEPAASGDLRPTSIQDVSQIRSPTGRVIGLWRTSTLRRKIESWTAEQPFPQGVIVKALGPSQFVGVDNELLAVSLGPTMPGWRLSLALADAESFDTAANERVAFFLWTAVVVVVITGSLALLVANMLRQQTRLTRLKNDLVATVSHELKTPLASIRLLVDTLLESDGSPDSPFGDHVRAREYLEMIAQENARLSRLIDNFLTFSRMERGKHRFDFQPTDASAIVDQAVAAVADRFDGIENTLRVDVQRPLPLEGDFDALVTVVVNLLDNAWKYTDSPKRIAVTARRRPAAAGAQDRITIAVEDNGIGLSPRAVRKVFDRFYQVDQHLSRGHGGCGLGLSIVKYIVEAHGGQVTAESRLGKGTKFTVSLPADSIPQSTAEKDKDLTQRRKDAKV